jgi:3,4-dihydroxy-2-butanone 4-phosphate synthase
MGQHEQVRPGTRLVRGWLAGILSTTAAGASHYAADGSTPDLVLLLMAVAAAGLVCVLLAGVRMGPARLGVAVALSQGAYHALFSVPALAPCTATGVAEQAHHGAATIHTT